MSIHGKCIRLWTSIAILGWISGNTPGLTAQTVLSGAELFLLDDPSLMR